METFVGCENVIQLTTKYDKKEVMPLLLIIFYQLNSIVEAIVPPCDETYVQIEKDDNNMFGVGASIEEPSKALVITELSLF